MNKPISALLALSPCSRGFVIRASCVSSNARITNPRERGAQVTDLRQRGGVYIVYCEY